MLIAVSLASSIFTAFGEEGWVEGARAHNYTVKYVFNYKWFDRAGKLLEEEELGGMVAVSTNAVLVQPLPIRAVSNAVFFAWAPSPFRSNEWIIGAESRSAQDEIRTVWIDSHPTRDASDLGANLGRIMYIPAEHPIWLNFKDCDRYYLSMESGAYRPDEVEFKITRETSDSDSQITRITAYSPSYYREYRSPSEFRTNRFKGPPENRKLWVLAIQSYTNWHGIQLPAKFSYCRYSDPLVRVDEEDEKPIILCAGSLVSATSGATTEIASRLAPHLAVEDFRFKMELGLPVRYTSSPAAWPCVDSKDFKNMIATNKMWLAGMSTGPQSKKSQVILFIILITLITPLFLFLVRRRSLADNTEATSSEQLS